VHRDGCQGQALDKDGKHGVVTADRSYYWLQREGDSLHIGTTRNGGMCAASGAGGLKSLDRHEVLQTRLETLIIIENGRQSLLKTSNPIHRCLLRKAGMGGRC
jgi:hypothetical protein